MRKNASMRRRMLCQSALPLALLIAAAPAWAQDAAPAATEPSAQPGPTTEAETEAAEQTQGNDIIVTAQRRSQRLQDVPISVVAITGANLEDRGATNIKTVTNFIPNVELTNTNRPTAGGSAYAAWIRGVGSGDYAFPTDPGVGIYVDGVYLARTIGGLLSLADIERVEVLRGPQGTLYGRNTIGGAINVVTKAPTLSGAPNGQIMGRYGSYGRADLLGQFSAPIVNDKLGFKASASYFSSDGWGRRIYTGERLNGEDRLVLRGALLAEVAPDFTIDFRADYSRQRNLGAVAQIAEVTGTPALIARFNQFAAPGQAAKTGLPVGTVYGSAFALPGTYNTASTSPLSDDYDIGGGALTLTYAPARKFNVKSITAYRKLKSRIQVDGDNSPFTISFTDETIHDNQFSQELQANGTLLGGRLTYVAGIYYFREKGTSDRLSGSFNGVFEVTGVASDARNTFNEADFKAESYAAYTQNDLELFDGLELSLGGRLNRDKKTYTLQVSLPQRGVISIPRRSRTAKWTSFTPRVGLNWKPTEDILLYTSYSTGFKSGGFANPTAVSDAPVYDPEKLNTVEVGAKTQWLDRRITANVAGFYSKWKEIQLNVIVPGPTGGVVNLTSNGGDAELYGFEAELSARPAAGLSLNVGLGYTHNEFTRLSAGAITAGVNLGTKLPHVPAWSLVGGAQYSWSLPVGEFMIRGDTSYRSRQFLTIGDPTSILDGYALVSARASFQPRAVPGLEIGVEGTNLTNKRYLVYDQNASIFGVLINQPGDPRLVAVTAAYRF